MQFIKSLVLGGAKYRISIYLRMMRFARSRRMDLLARILEARLQRRYSVFISRKASIPASVEFKHPTGIVIGEGVVIGERVKVYQNVTLGGARIGDWRSNNYPIIGDDTVIFAGAVVVGKVVIGRNCTIGANAVVTRDVPDGHTAVGIPAKSLFKSNPL